MDSQWIVVADEGLARILRLTAPGRDLEEVERLTDAAAHADKADLRRDAQGRRAGSGTLAAGNVTASAGEDELHREAELFARRLAQWLADAQHNQRFERLRIAAAPRFLGLLRKALNPQVVDAVVDELDKDLIQLSLRDLTLRFFPPHAAGSGPSG